MNQGHKTWVAALAFALCANAAVAIPVPTNDGAAGGLDASALMAFYGVSLATSPVNAVEDKAVWMAKVQGLIAQAPAWLQQNVLASKTKAEFAANLAILESMQKATLESGATAVKSAAAGSVKAKGVIDPNLGSGPSDTVYTTLQPCRIMDTRNASGASGVQGPLVGNTLYHIPGFITTGLNWSQYGQLAPLSDCGLNSSAGANIWAVAIVITILNPNFDAYLGVSDTNNLTTVLSNVALNYTRGQGLSTLYIVPQTVVGNQIYFAMPAGLSANLIFDVVGYFAVSQATALQCVQSTLVTVNIPNGGTINFNSNACPAGFTEVSITCRAHDIFGGTQWTGSGLRADSQTADCQGVNASGSAQDYNAAKTCCRVPGR